MLPETFHFLRPFWLLSLPVLLTVWLISIKANDPLRGWRRTMDPALLTALRIEESGHRRIRSTLLLIGWMLAAVTVAGPTWKPEPSPFADDPVPVMVLLKADSSMMTQDLAPDRMERARLEVVDLAHTRKGLPLGLIAYSGTAHLVLPPTRDTSIVAEMAEEISPEIMPDEGKTDGGANLLAALRLAVQTMDQIQGPIVIVADSLRGGTGLAEFRRQHRNPIVILRTVKTLPRQDEAFATVAAELDATMQPLTPDHADTDKIIRHVASAPIAVAVAEAGSAPRWQEAAFWLCPVLLIICLTGFRKTAAHHRREPTTGTL